VVGELATRRLQIAPTGGAPGRGTQMGAVRWCATPAPTTRSSSAANSWCS